MYKPSRFTLIVLPLVSLVALSPEWARARAEPGTVVENVELKTLAGGKEKLLSNKVKANVFVFFRPNNERSLDALKQMATCEKEFGGKPVRLLLGGPGAGEADGRRGRDQDAGADR
jgi:hypothetical protein